MILLYKDRVQKLDFLFPDSGHGRRNDDMLVLQVSRIREISQIVYNRCHYYDEGFRHLHTHVKVKRKEKRSDSIIFKLLTSIECTSVYCSISMYAMGSTFPLSYVRITCTGQGAVVSTDPSILDFGRVKVLEEKKMNFELINDSPIPTQFAREVYFFSSFDLIIPLRSNG